MSSSVSARVLFLTTCAEVVLPSLGNIHVNRIYGPLTGALPSSFPSHQKTCTLYVGNQGQTAPVGRACETEACVCSCCRFGFDGTVGGTKCRAEGTFLLLDFGRRVRNPNTSPVRVNSWFSSCFPHQNVHLFTRTRCPLSFVLWIVCYRVKALDFNS